MDLCYSSLYANEFTSECARLSCGSLLSLLAELLKSIPPNKHNTDDNKHNTDDNKHNTDDNNTELGNTKQSRNSTKFEKEKEKEKGKEKDTSSSKELEEAEAGMKKLSILNRVYDMKAEAVVCQPRGAFANIRPPGHHAEPNIIKGRCCDAEGFCFYNNIAIAARKALQHNAINKVLIVDWDVHFGYHLILSSYLISSCLN